MREKYDSPPDKRASSARLESAFWLDHESISHSKPVVYHKTDTAKRLLHDSNTILRLIFRVLHTIFASNLALKILKGSETVTKKPITVCYIGDNINFHYMNNLIFSESPEIIKTEALSWWRINAIAGKIQKSVDLVILDVDFFLKPFIKKYGYLDVPRWIIQRLPIADNWEDVMARLRRKTRKEAQRFIRKFSFRALLIDGRQGGDYFYEHLYKPHIQKRHGPAAELVSRKHFTSTCRRGRIIQLHLDDEIIGAVLVRHAGDTLAIEWAGMKTSLEKTQLEGATDALDFFTLLYAYEAGYDFLDMGPSRARLNDGLLRYKRKWGAAIYRKIAPHGSLLISPLVFSEGVESVLIHNKFITQEDGKLICRVLLPANFDPKALAELIINEWVDGLHRLLLFARGNVGIESLTQDEKVEVVVLKESDNQLLQFTGNVPTPRQSADKI